MRNTKKEKSMAEEGQRGSSSAVGMLADGVGTYLQHVVAGTSAGFTAELLLFCVEIRNYPSIFQPPAAGDVRRCLHWRNTTIHLGGVVLYFVSCFRLVIIIIFYL